MSVAQLADVMIKELMEGVDGTAIRAGVIGELGMQTLAALLRRSE